MKGGYAWERDQHEIGVIATGVIIATARQNRGGWTVGAGAEYGFARNWSVFVEYDYYDFGNKSAVFHDAAGAFYTQVKVDEQKHVAKVGLNLRWGPGR